MLNIELVKTIAYSFYRLILAYILSLFLSLVMALLSEKWGNISEGLLVVFSTMLKVPNIAFLTFFMLFIGIGTPTVMMTIIVSLVPTMGLAFMSVLKQADKHVIEISDIFRVPFIRRVFYFYLPSLVESFPPIFNMSFSLAFKVMVMAEFVAGMNGLGYKLVEKKVSFNMDEVIGYIILIVLTGVFFQSILEKIVIRFKKWI
ncbi:MAG: ABC transporter permease subunit [Calditerrivibrio sp.]|nr:ABC transporter permease subunit [Calditerrivibrio sp.]